MSTPAIAVSGAQLAFLVGALWVCGTALAYPLVAWLGLPDGDIDFFSRIIPFSAGAAILVAVPAFRARTAALLAAPVPANRLGEVAVVAVMALLGQFALFGSFALRNWLEGGDLAIVHMQLNPDRDVDAAFSAATLRTLAITCLAAPLLEEIVFRGFLFEAWTKTRSVFLSMLFTSAVFGLVHPNFTLPFLVGMLLNALYLRTGSLRAPIFVHFLVNASLWYPLLAQFVIPAHNTGLGSWWFHLTCLAVLPIAMILYVIVAARSRKPTDTTSPELQPAT